MRYARDLKITQKSAWFMLHRIRLGNEERVSRESWAARGGPVEVDETFIGGKMKNMHKDRKLRYTKRGGAFGKAIVMGMLDRDSRQVRAKVIPNVKKETLQGEILKNDRSRRNRLHRSALGYDNLAAKRFIHETVNQWKSTWTVKFTLRESRTFGGF